MTGPGGTERPTFDPRHDPRFQRGYRPGDALPDRHSPAAAVPDALPAPAGPTIDQAPVDPDGLHDFDSLVFEADDVADEPEPSGWNPFIAVLWLISVVLVAGSLALQLQAVSSMFSNTGYSGSGEVPLDLQLQQLSYVASPSMLAAGLITLTGLLFWHAFAWRARRQGAADA